HERVRLGDRVGVARARGGDVERGGGRRAEPLREHGGGRGGLVEVRDGRDDDGVDVGALEAGAGERVARGRLGQVEDVDVRPRAPARDDAGALADPLVRRVDRPGDVVVRHDVLAAHAADREDARVRRARGLAQCRAHASAPAVDAPPTTEWRAMRSRAASTSSGDFTATDSTPLSARRASPVSTPPGASSRIAVTPRSASVSWHKSQRTGAAICAVRRRTTSRALPYVLPSMSIVAYDSPSAFERNGTRGSLTSHDAATGSNSSSAGCMNGVWNAPATWSGMTRALAGGFSARAARWSSAPAATTCPPPLTFAGHRWAASIAASTSCGSPPTTALIPVGVCAAAAAMARARWETRPTAPVSVSAPATAAAASSPTEWPAVTSTTSVVSRPSRITRSATSEDATMSGWATAVSRIASASDSVPCARRSRPAASPNAATWSATPGRSSQGASIPGDWEPCPGHKTASTRQLCQRGALPPRHDPHQPSEGGLCRTYRGPGEPAPRPGARVSASPRAGRGRARPAGRTTRARRAGPTP